MTVVAATCVLLAAWPAAGDDAAPRPRLQLINGSDQAAAVQWLKDDTEKVPAETIPPGGQATIDTTLGHRFLVTGQRDGRQVTVTVKQRVQAARFDFVDAAGIPARYAQRASAGGYPVVASAAVSPFALGEAVALIDLLLAKRPDVRRAMIESGSRLCIIGWNEFTTDLPEFGWLAADPVPGFAGLAPRDYWDARARGLGGSESDPFCSCGEENLLCYPGDPYSTENILIHEFAHNIHLRGLVNVDPTFDARLGQAYAAAMQAGLWRGKYAGVNHHEYFAEGVQSWFDDNRENDHDHNHVDTRAELIDYDPGLARLCREVFGDTELRYTKPPTRLTGHLEGYDPAAAPTFAWPERLTLARRRIREHAEVRNRTAAAPEPPAAEPAR
jgi:hypothetical protein